jgi:putative hydrolase
MPLVADGGPTGDNPFEGMPFFGDLAKMLSGQGGMGLDAARQLAQQIASGGVAEANPDPTERIRLESLTRVAEMRVADLTGLATSTTGQVLRVVPVTRAEWARRTLDAYRPYLERLSQSLSSSAGPAAADDEESGDGDPTAQLLGGIFSMMSPMLFGMQSGAMVGQLGARSLGQYDLPLPRPASDELVIVSTNVDAFGDKWSPPPEDLRLWLCLSEIATHAVLGVPHVRTALEALVLEYVGSFSVDTGALEERIGGVDPTDLAGLQQALGDPASLLGAIQSPAQRALLPRLAAVVDVVVGYVDWVVDSVGTGLIGSYGMLTEALHRRRVEATEGDRFVEHLLGLQLGRAQYERGEAFVAGVVERAGPDGLARLWQAPEHLPTPAEVDAPGRWLARIDL